MSLVIRMFVRGGVWLAGLAPEPLRSALRRDSAFVLQATCERALRHRGWIGLLRAGLVEWTSLLLAALNERLGRPARITGGAAPRPSGHPTGGTMRRLHLDLRQAWRGLVAARGTAALAVVTLALGIGVNSAVFSMLDSILWRPVPFAAADRLVELMNVNTKRGMTYGGFRADLVSRWRTQQDLFDRVEAYDRASFVYRAPGGTEMVPGSIVTPGLLTMLGVGPELGRLFTPEDGRTGTDRVAIVSDGFWRSRLQRSPHVIGSVLSLNGASFTIVGVMPASFRFPNEVREIWVPYDVDVPPAAPIVLPTRLVPFVRVRADVTFEQAASQVTARGARLGASVGASPDLSASIWRPAELGDEKTRRSLLVLGGAVGFLLLIVCANVANLTLSRALIRTRDLAVRAALGASRTDLVRQTLVEQALIGVLGVAGGLAVAHFTLAAALGVLPDSMTTSTFNAIDVDARVVGAAMLLGAMTVLFFGFPPAWLASRAGMADILRRGSRPAVGGPAARRFRASLVVVEVALSIILLVGAAVLTRSLLKLQAVDKGLDTTNLVSMTLGLPASGYRDPVSRDRLALNVATRLRSLPGVVSATAGGLPSELSAVGVGELEFSDRPGLRTEQIIVPLHEVPPNYFATLRLPVLRGRAFLEDEPAGSVVVSERFARKYWPNDTALGGRFRVGDGAWRTVVGVVGDVPRLSDGASQPLGLYYPLGQDSGAFRPTLSTSLIIDFRTILVRSGNPTALVAELRGVVRDVDPAVVLWKTDLVDHLYADAIARPRVIFLMMSVLAIVGLALAAAGLYGVLSCLVTQRLREIGVRLALGANARDVGRLILGNGLMLTISGLILGVGMSLALARVLRTLLYGVEPSDPVAIAAVAVLVLATSVAASWRPVRRAMRVDPVALLRED